jgi:hypothetical protein
MKAHSHINYKNPTCQYPTDCSGHGVCSTCYKDVKSTCHSHAPSSTSPCLAVCRVQASLSYVVFRHRRVSCSDTVVICRIQTLSRVVFRHCFVTCRVQTLSRVVFRHCSLVSCSNTVLSHVVFRHCPTNASHAPNKLIIFQGKSNILCSCAALLLSLASFALSSRSGLCMSASCATSSRVAT